jgi:drug/metabolite transporter (DMT)-like permease
MPGTSGTVQESAHGNAVSNAARLRSKTRLFTGIVIVSNVSGNSALTHGMKLLGDIGNSPWALIGALFHPWVALGVALLILWTLTMMALLSWADLTYVLPVTAIGYVLTALSGKYLLGETVSLEHWAGIFLITSGVILVGLTTPVSTVGQAPQ